jgi:hypothetical protein
MVNRHSRAGHVYFEITCWVVKTTVGASTNTSETESASKHTDE